MIIPIINAYVWLWIAFFMIIVPCITVFWFVYQTASLVMSVFSFNRVRKHLHL